MPDDQETTFRRRKFTITEALDEMLVKLAEQHYQGNVSLCLRAAIKDHHETLSGTDTAILTQRLEQQVQMMKEDQEEIIRVLQSVDARLDKHQEASDQWWFATDQLSEFQSRILSALREVERGVRITDLAETLGVHTGRLSPVLGDLVDRGLVTTTETTPTRFHLAGRPNPSVD